jgi:hypothetical protein
VTKTKAILLILVGCWLVGAVLGLLAAGANGAALCLGAVIPLAIASYLSSGVVTRDDPPEQRRY